ncbi:PaaI family thioesterase [Antrihabitans sp. YC2-6]|uniref:PaaI family thioesterase n=1 Tax=Antrihabitans sp. YC2-6 TaxID=2799498 RepID=UPI0018F2B5C5|nr:PaaI family thioesterase [Antrihabitans sp. YC2-6]MBJ8347965.1 PaaI family thioesterase [Antrihabitans sp. YC2-6]
MTLTIEDARGVLQNQPFNALVGGRLVVFEVGSATLEIDIRDELRQQFGFVHGGVLAYAADNALTFAGGSVLGPSVVTGGFTITYLRPAAGSVLRAHASVVSSTRRQAVCRCDLYVEIEGLQPVLCAAAQGTITRIEQTLPAPIAN